MNCSKSLLAVLLVLPLNAMAFPEIPFCPLGGPPGWYNRMFDNDRYYPPPGYYPVPISPAYRSYPVYPYHSVVPAQIAPPAIPKP